MFGCSFLCWEEANWCFLCICWIVSYPVYSLFMFVNNVSGNIRCCCLTFLLHRLFAIYFWIIWMCIMLWIWICIWCWATVGLSYCLVNNFLFSPYNFPRTEVDWNWLITAAIYCPCTSRSCCCVIVPSILQSVSWIQKPTLEIKETPY